MDSSYIYALDFDGVICDSAVETGITGWQAAGTIWNMPKAIPGEIIDQFRQIRPLIETGYEAVLAMRLLYQGETVDAIYNHFADKMAALIVSNRISIDELKTAFGNTRDRWIVEDFEGWVSMNPLFTGVADKLVSLNNNVKFNPWYIVTTKQERFVKHILKANAINVLDENVFGLDRNMSKEAVLTELVARHPRRTVYFIEDRLPALMNVTTNVGLKRVKTVFALWGYNTDEDKALARKNFITVQQLENFLE